MNPFLHAAVMHDMMGKKKKTAALGEENPTKTGVSAFLGKG